MKIGQMMIVTVITGIAILGMAETDFSDVDSVALVDKKIQLKTAERKKLLDGNPCVVFAEEDNVGMNVKKTMTRDQYHRSALTVINRTFYCPIHKNQNGVLRHGARHGSGAKKVSSPIRSGKAFVDKQGKVRRP